MADNESTWAELVLGPADGEMIPIPLRPDGLPIKVVTFPVAGDQARYVRRHQAVGRNWIYVHEPEPVAT